jgi:hypothetical protein
MNTKQTKITKPTKAVKIKPLCVCEKCGAGVTPSKAEAGRFLMQFRKTPYDPKKMAEYGKLGGRPRKVSNT